MNDGAVPINNENPSAPLIVKLRVNNTFISTMVDTGSAKSIINIKTLQRLNYRPFIKYQKNVHQTANNSELRTIGLVRLKINLKDVSTFILAEVATDLCTALVLGNDWINQNKIDILTTKKCISKRIGFYTVNIPFSTYNEETYPVFPTYPISVLPEQGIIIPVRTKIKDADTVIFTPSKTIAMKKGILIPHSLLKIKNGIARITMINASDSPKYINMNVILGTISFPSVTSMSLPLLPIQTTAISAERDLKCRVCYNYYKSSKELFNHLHQTGHFADQRLNGSYEQLPPDVFERIKQLVSHVPNSFRRKQLESLLIKNGKLFDTSKAITIRSSVKHTIEVKNSRPIVQRPYRKTTPQEKLIADLSEQFYRDKIIRPSQSPWASPVVLQRKKDGTWRFCIDYRKLNEVTEKDNYPLPRIQEILDTLGGAKYFSKLDFQGGYYQVPIDESDKPKTAFVTRDQLWEYNVMPQGIKNGPPTFQRIINNVLGQLQWTCALSYIDDIIIYSKSIDDHIYHLEQVLSVLSHANFRLNSAKCEFMQEHIKFLGHMIDARGIVPCPDKINAITNIPVPKSTKAATSFVKMAEYYRNHIPNFSIIAKPLFDLTKKNVKFTWCDEQQNAFQLIKNALTSKPLLVFPDSDKPFIIQVDASNYGIGAVLMQNHGQGEQPIAYMSQKLNKQQQNWNATEKECYAVISSIQKWNHFVTGRDFTIRTDHHALCWLNRKYNSNPKLNRWRMALQEYTFKIEHVKGKRNCVADCLSRFPVNQPIDDDIEHNSIGTQTEAIPALVSAVTTRRMIRQQHSAECQSADTDERGGQSAETSGENERRKEVTGSEYEPQTTTSRNCECSKLSNQINVFTNEQLQRYQQEDEFIKNVLENINKKPFIDQYNINHNNLLCRKIRRFNRIYYVPVLPKIKINDVLLAYHNSLMNGGHLGKDRTYYKIRNRYYWPGMYKNVVQHIRSCSNCSINKKDRKKPNGHLNQLEPPQGVWENLSMDFIGPLTPKSSSGNVYILVITDLLSKYVVAKATRDNTSLTAAKVVVEEVMLKYGIPKQILTDNGTHFSAKLFNDITRLCGVCHVYTTPYNPQSNGACERFNSTLCDNLATLCNNNRTDWDEKLSKIIFAYNTTRHASTKFTPFELMFGRDVKLPFDLPQQTTTVIEPHQYAQQLKDYLKMAVQIICTNIQNNQFKSKQRHDSHRTNNVYSIGDFVFIKRLGLHGKFDKKYAGPYQVVQQLNNSIYRLQNPNDLRQMMNVHTNRLRRCY